MFAINMLQIVFSQPRISLTHCNSKIWCSCDFLFICYFLKITLFHICSVSSDAEYDPFTSILCAHTHTKTKNLVSKILIP